MGDFNYHERRRMIALERAVEIGRCRDYLSPEDMLNLATDIECWLEDGIQRRKPSSE